jgi:hypothetical protein
MAWRMIGKSPDFIIDVHTDFLALKIPVRKEILTNSMGSVNIPKFFKPQFIFPKPLSEEYDLVLRKSIGLRRKYSYSEGKPDFNDFTFIAEYGLSSIPLISDELYGSMEFSQKEKGLDEIIKTNTEIRRICDNLQFDVALAFNNTFMDDAMRKLDTKQIKYLQDVLEPVRDII